MRSLPSSSLGFGGITPLVNAYRLSTFVACTAALSGVSMLMQLERPSLLERPKFLCTVGLRISQSIISTLLPACVSTTAKLAIVVLLPSLGVELVKASVFSSLPACANWMLVRITRYASVAGFFKSLCAIRFMPSIFSSTFSQPGQVFYPSPAYSSANPSNQEHCPKAASPGTVPHHRQS